MIFVSTGQTLMISRRLSLRSLSVMDSEFAPSELRVKNIGIVHIGLSRKPLSVDYLFSCSML